MENQTYKTNLRLIRGGLSEDWSTSEKLFIYAEITDTRLMGVVGMHIYWKLPENKTITNYHQFFYFDAEEYAFDTFESVLGKGDEEELRKIDEIESRMIGGLGGSKIGVSEKEARYLVQEYADLSKDLGEPLPGNEKEYKDLLMPRVELSDLELSLVNKKQCTPVHSPYQAINYFIMRCTGRDFKAAKLLTKGYVRTDLFREYGAAALIQNVIEDMDDDTGSNSRYKKTGSESVFSTFKTCKAYRCTATIEYEGGFYINVSKVVLENLKIVEYERISTFGVTEREVAMRTSRREFVSVFDLGIPGAGFIDRSTALTKNAMIVEHNMGRLHMIFYPHNDHVNSRKFNLNADVMGLYYVLDNGQVILAAYTRDNIKLLEADLLRSAYGPGVSAISKYQFADPTLYEFVASDMDDFEEFIQLIALGFGDDDGRNE